jgi:hypothetical protein
MPYIPDMESGNALSALLASVEEPYHEYWFHLGRFVHSFAAAEAELLFLLRDISALTKERAGVMFSGTRSEEARNLINRFLEVTKQAEKKTRLHRPFSQFGVIGTIRNNLVHWGAESMFSNTFVVSNASRHPIKPVFYTVSISDFINMCRDLSLIQSMFSAERKGSTWNDEHRDGLATIPWRYKPSQQVPLRNTQDQDRSK